MVQTTTDPGTISVPMSSILDALQGVLTEDERTALFEQLIGLRPAGVSPGDLITAELFNQVLSDINDLSVRLANLEGATGGPILESLDPPSIVAVNGLLIVTGKNFNPARNLNTVKIGDVEITQFRADSSPTHLLFPVPDLFTGLPGSFPVRVITGGRTSNALSITIQQPDQIQQGQFVFGPGQVPPGAPTIGQPLAITWNVQAVTMFPDNVILSLLVGSAQGATAAAWLATVAIQPPSPMALLAGQSKQVAVTVTVPAGATSAQLSLRVASKDGNVINVSDPVTVNVGQAVEVSDARIDFSFDIAALAAGGGMTKGKVTIDGVEGDGILVKKGQTGKLKFHALDKRASGANADFTLVAEIVAPANGLTVTTGPNPTASPPAGITAGGDLPFDLPLSAPAGATTGATARLKVTCNQTKASGGLTAYKGFKIIPLKIVD
ncbi:MAG: IPT/TIG domain-containing protein [Sphingomonas sp.]